MTEGYALIEKGAPGTGLCVKAELEEHTLVGPGRNNPFPMMRSDTTPSKACLRVWNSLEFLRGDWTGARMRGEVSGGQKRRTSLKLGALLVGLLTDSKIAGVSRCSTLRDVDKGEQLKLFRRGRAVEVGMMLSEFEAMKLVKSACALLPYITHSQPATKQTTPPSHHTTLRWPRPRREVTVTIAERSRFQHQPIPSTEPPEAGSLQSFVDDFHHSMSIATPCNCLPVGLFTETDHKLRPDTEPGVGHHKPEKRPETEKPQNMVLFESTGQSHNHRK
ncbi:hypothetical protein G7Y89_g5986 [Cudoniella acicularis]|uniref:Uncharacterized protein n=1 Tax=Cudoniella acicularis TaxID=354080 RepID=A0A8H4RPN2_9HELO|nr:hypothetical protein G7Y89_g5986 [Cudoniella acicularis]